MLQIWMYGSPIVYPMSMIPDQWRWLFSINPMSGIIEGFRWALIGQGSMDIVSLMISFVTLCVVVTGGVIYFKHMERSFADVI